MQLPSDVIRRLESAADDESPELDLRCKPMRGKRLMSTIARRRMIGAYLILLLASHVVSWLLRKEDSPHGLRFARIPEIAHGRLTYGGIKAGRAKRMSRSRGGS